LFKQNTSGHVIKLYSNFKSFNLIFQLPNSLKYEIIFHNFVCQSFPTPASAPAKYAGAPALVLRRTALEHTTFAINFATYLCDFLNEFLAHIFWEEFGTKLELKWGFLFDVLCQDL
jgi:hypothetical protein